jgi:hypothetical protein
MRSIHAGQLLLTLRKWRRNHDLKEVSMTTAKISWYFPKLSPGCQSFSVALLMLLISAASFAAMPFPVPGPPQHGQYGTNTCTDADVENLMAKVPVSLTSRIYVTGPYVGGTQLVEDSVDSPVVLKVGSTDGAGSFCVYFIDDDVDPNAPPSLPLPPSIKFDHPVRFAWTNQNQSDNYGVASANNTLTVYPYPHGTTPKPFVYLNFATVNGVPTTYGFGEFAAEPLENPGAGPQEAAPVTQQAGGCLYRALVIDGGDKKAWLTKDIAEAAYLDAGSIEVWLINPPYGFDVIRKSQYWDSKFIPSYPAGAEEATFTADIQAYVNQYSTTPVGKDCHHEFFLYIGSHGSGGKGAFYLYKRDGSGSLPSGKVAYTDLLDALKRFPSDEQHLTTVYVMADACFAGTAVQIARVNYGVPPHYAFQAVGVVGSLHTAPAGHAFFSKSGTEYFLDVASPPATMTTGFQSVQKGLEDRNPERFRAPDKEGVNWFKLDP